MGRFREWRQRRIVRKAEHLLATLDDSMKNVGMSRSRRRQIWRELIAGRHPDVPID